MGVFDGIEDLGKASNGFIDGRIEPRTAPPGPTSQTSVPPATLARLGDAIKSASGSPILNAGQALIAGMRLTTGWDEPERGDSFGRGAQRFTRVGETVGSAYPGEDWQGAGAQAYATANRRQAGRAESMATLDRRVQTVIAREAYQITYHRNELDDQSNYLGDLSYLTWPIALAPGAGKAMKAVIELGAVSAAMTICSAELYQLSQETGENAAQLRELAGEYSALIRTGTPPDLGDMPPPPSDDPLETVPTEKPGTDPTVERGTGQAPPTVDPGSAPTTPQTGAFGSAPAGASVPAPHANPVIAPAAGEIPGTSETATQPALPTEMMSGMASAFGAVGGMIGSVVAPLAAVLTGAVGAAGQSLSTLTSADVATAADDAADDTAADVAAEAAETGGPAIDDDSPDIESTDDRDLPGSAAGAGDGSGQAPAVAVTESEESQTQPTDILEPPRPPVPPAAIRPPQ